MSITRRSMLGASVASLGLAGLPLSEAFAQSAGAGDLKFLFVVNYGGWDPTRVFAAEFDNAAVDMERDAELATVGNLAFVDHEDRPAVRSFLQRHYERTLFVNGILVPSVAHENCLKLIMTGKSSDDSADWPAILASARRADFALPHLVIDGPSYAGKAGGVVARTGTSGQLEGLLSGDIIAWSDLKTRAPDANAEALMDDFVARRLNAEQTVAQSEKLRSLLESYDNSLDQAAELKDLLDVIDWGGGGAFSQQISMAVDALKMGVSRCATLAFSYYSWDSHTENDLYQSANFEQLFQGLNDLMEELETAPGELGGSLADETVVVVCSEMGRTPALNSQDGKDHWPYTCMMMVGPKLAGNRVIGGYDPYYYGVEIDNVSGDIVDSGEGAIVSSANVGATLLALADVDPSEHLQGIDPIDAILG